MRLRSWILPAAILAVPFVFPVDGAIACLRFKKPGGSVKPGLREPADPPPPPPSTPAPTTPTDAPPSTTPSPTPSAPVTPTTPAPTPLTGGPGPNQPGDGPAKKKADDDSTWETWYLFNRIEFFPHRYVSAVVSHEGPVLRGVKPLAPDVVRAKLWGPLLTLKDDPHVFVREAALITIGRVASDDSLKKEAREILEKAIKDKNQLVARAAALGLFYVADDSSFFPMRQVASDPKVSSDVRAFLAITLTSVGSDQASTLLPTLVSADKNADFDLTSAALMALGYTPGPESARFLKETFENKKFRAELRAMAAESFGRRGNVADAKDILFKAIVDRETEVRRSAAIAMGVLDYRTEAEKEIARLTEPYDVSTGAPLPADVKAKVDELTKLIPDQQEPIEKTARDFTKKLVYALENDNDVFVCSMAAISLGRIAAQLNEKFAVSQLEADLKKERNVVREYEILALAIAKSDKAFDIAKDAVEGRNKQATTQAAGMTALGILGDQRGADILRKQIEDGENPVLRGYAALALGMLGGDKASGPILSLLKSTKSPDAMEFAALGFGLLGKKQGSDLLVKKLQETANGEIAAYCVYSLGLMKDRSKLDELLDVAQHADNSTVQAAAVASLGYLSSAEDYPRRHLMARGFNYMLNLQLLEAFFYKL